MRAEVLFKNQLKMLDSAIHDLKGSKLLNLPEFNLMLKTIKTHHDNVKLAHLTGTPKDSLEQTRQDTSFYYILVRMLNEVNSTISEDGSHLENLAHVFDWFTSNKHVLHSTPRFGKNRDKEKPLETVKTSIGRLQREALQVHLKFNNTQNRKVAMKENLSPQTQVQQETVAERREIRPKTSPALKTSATPMSATSGRSTVSVPVERVESLLKQRKPQPLSHLYNPHSGISDANTSDDFTPKLKMKHIGNQNVSAKESRSPKINHLAKWEEFQRESNFGQDYLSSMQHMGRRGVPGGVRYVAHENGLTAEDFTQQIIKHYSAWEKAQKQAGVEETKKAAKLLENSLEEFYEMAQKFYPVNPPKTKEPRIDDENSALRMQSAPPGGCRVNKSPVAAPHAPRKASSAVSKSAQSKDVCLDAIVGLIDSVKEEMAFHKEKLVPDPQPGFRQPALKVEAKDRPQTAPTLMTFVRPMPDASSVAGLSDTDVIQTDLEKIASLELYDWRGRISSAALSSTIPDDERRVDTPMSYRSVWAPTFRPCTAPVQVVTKPEKPSYGKNEMDTKSDISFLSIHTLGNKQKKKQKSIKKVLKPKKEIRAKGVPVLQNMEFVSLVVPKSDTQSILRREDSAFSTHALLPDSSQQDNVSYGGDISDLNDDLADMSDTFSYDDGMQGLDSTQHCATENLLDHVSEVVRMDSIESEIMSSAPVRTLPSNLYSPFKNPPEDIEMSVSGLHAQNNPQHMTDEEVDEYLRSRKHKAQSAVSSAKSPRVFTRAFPKEKPVRCNINLKIEGKNNKNERSVGRIPSHSKATDRFQTLVRQKEMLRKSATNRLRTPPSIPSSFNPFGSRKVRGSNAYSVQHEAHARRDHSPRSYMDKVGEIMRKDNFAIPQMPCQSDLNHEPDPFASAIQVIKLHHSTQSPGSAPAWKKPSAHLLAIQQQALSDFNRGFEFNQEPLITSVPKKPVPRDIRIVIMPAVAPVKSATENGRPIPSYGDNQDPKQAALQVERLRQAKAAVDIQRIFRGFIARNHYKYLQREDRERREDERKAAVEIQRAYRRHLSRKKAISKRPKSAEDVEWAKQYRQGSAKKELERNDKAQEVAKKNRVNSAKASKKIAVIGPHVEIYEPFHPKNISPEKKLLHKAATIIQRHVRGYLLRLTLGRLKRKSKQHANSWARFIGTLKERLGRIQQRMGIEKKIYLLNFKNINNFMDVKKRYESVFERKAFGGELEVTELMDYFKECDLYPTQSEIEDSLRMVLRGKVVKGQNKGLSRNDALELTFQLYPPAGCGIEVQRKSTWMNPIVDGEEASKLIGSEQVEDTDFKTCWEFVAATRKEQNRREQKKLTEKKDEEWEMKHAKSKRKTAALNAIGEGEEEEREEQA